METIADPVPQAYRQRALALRVLPVAMCLAPILTGVASLLLPAAVDEELNTTAKLQSALDAVDGSRTRAYVAYVVPSVLSSRPVPTGSASLHRSGTGATSMSLHRRRTKDGRVRYFVRWREGGRGGRNRQQSFDTYKDAQRFETSLRRARQLGQLSAEVIGSEQAFADFVGEWWERYAVVHLRPGTLTSYAYVLDRWIIPMLGEVALRELSREMIDAYVAALLGAVAGQPTVNRARSIVQGILRRAVEWRRIAMNPAIGVPRLTHLRDQRITARTPARRSLVFPDLRGGYLRRQNWRRRVWLPALRAADPRPECTASGRLKAGE